MYKTVFFDLDGTLTDSKMGIINGVIYALKKFNIEEKAENLLAFIGPPLYESFIKYYNFTPEKSKMAVEFYREYFKDIGIFENSLYNGVKELLERLKKEGLTLVLATSKPEVFAFRVLDYFELTKSFEYKFGATFSRERDSKEAVIKYALSKVNVNKSETIMVGDREHDIYGAKVNGLDSIGVLYGYGGVEELTKEGATYLANTVEEIFDIITKKNG